MNNTFVFVAPMCNASDTLPQMLYSLYAQSYSSWHLVLVDDVSSPIHKAIAECTIEKFKTLGSDKVTVLWNEQKLWEVANVLQGTALCNDEDIVCRIDGDDYLCDLDALKILNEVYKQTQCDAAWTKHRWFDDDGVTVYNISAPLPENADVYKHPWVSSHLKTFKKRLLNSINDQNFRRWDGQYVTRAGDQCLYLPILKQAKRKTFVPLVTYAYRCCMRPETFQSDDAKLQKREAEFIRARGFVP